MTAAALSAPIRARARPGVSAASAARSGTSARTAGSARQIRSPRGGVAIGEAAGVEGERPAVLLGQRGEALHRRAFEALGDHLVEGEQAALAGAGAVGEGDRRRVELGEGAARPLALARRGRTRNSRRRAPRRARGRARAPARAAPDRRRAGRAASGARPARRWRPARPWRDRRLQRRGVGDQRRRAPGCGKRARAAATTEAENSVISSYSAG